MNSKQRIVIGLVFVLVSLFAYVGQIHHLRASAPILTVISAMSVVHISMLTSESYVLEGDRLSWHLSDPTGDHDASTTRDMSADLARLFSRYDVTHLVSDQSTPPDTPYWQLKLHTANGELAYYCVHEETACTKLSEDLANYFRPHIVH